MIDLSVITPRLLTGGGVVESQRTGRLSSDDLVMLQAKGVTHVLDVQEIDDNEDLLRSAGILYRHNPTSDDGQPKSADWFNASLSFALPMFAWPHTRIYCHCAAGVNRGPSTAYAIMLALGWDSLAAMMAIHVARPVALIRYAADAEKAIESLGYQ